MEMSDELRSKVSIEMSTIVIVKNRCQFCYAFFKNRKKIAEHSIQCKFRFSETFEAFDGKVKFACAICFDVFQTRAEHMRHERLHKFPGGFPCAICDEIFLNEFERNQHEENVHEESSREQRDGKHDFACYDCGAFFEQESYLRLHNETNCGTHRTQRCVQCNLLTEDNCKFVSEEEDALLIPKAEVSLTEGENISPYENIVENDRIARFEANIGDPLLLVVKEEVSSEVHTEISGGLMDDSADEKYFDEENSPDNLSDVNGHSTCENITLNSVIDIGASENEYICKYCDKRYFTESNLEKHVVVHGPDGNLVHRCDLCPIYFKTTDERATHRLEVHKERLTCTLCDKYCRTKQSWHSHMATHRRKIVEKKKDNDGRMRKNPKGKQLPFECNYCDRSFAASQTLYRHKFLHGPDGNLVHKCQCCFSHFASIKERDTHMLAAHKDRLTCNICNITYRHAKTRLAHHSQHHKVRNAEKGFECTKCGQSFADRKQLDTHLQSDCEILPINNFNDADDLSIATGAGSIEGTNERATSTDGGGRMDNVIRKKRKRRPKSANTFICPHCGRSYSAKRGLDRHVIEHGPDGSLVHKCDICPIRFKSVADRDAHQMDVHKSKLTCNICNKLFRRYSTLFDHVRNHAKSGPKQQFVCAKCGVTFLTITNLKSHEQSDCGRSPTFKCDECGKSYANKYRLKIHKSSHGYVEKKFACTHDQCDRRFRYESSLKIHMRNHSGEKPFQCDHCDKRFADLSYLKTHMTLHMAIKRFVCYGCGGRFPTNSALHKHRKCRKDTCALVPIKPPTKDRIQ